MTPEENSLKKYNYGIVNSGQSANNFCRPNVTNFKPESGRLYQTQYENIMISSPKVNWTGYTSSDPILNFGSTSTDIGGTGFIETVGKIASGISLFGGMAMTGLGIANAVQTIKAAKNNQQANGTDNFSRKENKEINKSTTNAENEMQALDSAITTGESLIDSNSDDTETIKKAHENLMASITRAQSSRDDASRNITTAEKTKGNLVKQRDSEQANYDSLLVNKTDTSNKIDDLKSQLNNQNLTDEEKSKIKDDISNYEKQLNNIEKELKKSKEKIENFNQQISVQDQIIKNNTAIVKDLDANIQSAQKLEPKLATKTKVNQ